MEVFSVGRADEGTAAFEAGRMEAVASFVAGWRRKRCAEETLLAALQDTFVFCNEVKDIAASPIENTFSKI